MTSATLNLRGKSLQFDPESAIDLSIPLQFDGPQPNVYGVPPASARACRSEGLVGDTRVGGSCNFEEYRLIPHCNGTHTECVGHLTHERISIRDSLSDVLMPAVLVSVEPESVQISDETYRVETNDDDRLITARSLEGRIGTDEALIVRTLPNDETKLRRDYGANPGPYFSTDAMEFIVKSGVRHLLVDTPSIDRMFDEGKLSNHRIFWGVDAGSFNADNSARRNATITELIYVPEDVPDGEYLLNLQVAPFNSDAAPSRPIIFPLS